MKDSIRKQTLQELTKALPQIVIQVMQILHQNNIKTQLDTKMIEDVMIQSTIVHKGVTCLGCQVTPITGICYKCTACQNFNLCWKCEMTTRHIHPLLKLRNAE